MKTSAYICTNNKLVMTTKQFGNVVAYWRRNRRMTALSLSKKACISNSLLSKFENGKVSISLNNLCKILTILDLNVFFQDANEKKDTQIIK